MTKETRTLIELRDTLGVELECVNPKCRAKIMLPIDNDFPRQDYRCFQCQQEWFGASIDGQTGQVYSAAIMQINDLMKRIRQLTGERSDIKVPIRLHIASLKE